MLVPGHRPQRTELVAAQRMAVPLRIVELALHSRLAPASNPAGEPYKLAGSAFELAELAPVA